MSGTLVAAPPIPILLCFDVEPDEAEVAMEARPWVGFERLLERTCPLRQQLSIATGRPVQFNWFVRMDPQIGASHGSNGWVADRYGDRLEALRAAGDLVGLHPHAWRRLTASGRWLADHGDPEWVDHCVRVSFETFEATMGEGCRAVRFGDRFLSARVVRRFAELGARYDLTVEPGAPALRSMHNAASTGSLPSMIGAPRRPYRASIGDPFRPARHRDATDAGLWMIPLTSLNPDSVLVPWRRVGRRLRHPRGPRHRPAPLFAPMWQADQFWRSIQEELAGSSGPYLAFAIRSDAPIRPALNGAVEDKLAALLRSPLVKQLVFTTPDAVVESVLNA